jgi:serine/threonine protein kinase/Tfp pilus assembly protein PilF
MMPFTIGETIGPYQLVEQLGQGGMATVFKAYHPALDRYVAIKALHPAFTLEPNFLARFQREAQVVARLEHPNIVPVFDYAEHEGRPFLVMKFIEGQTLKARLSSGPLEIQEINAIVESVGAALGYAHAQGVLHRDVKPSNVLLAEDGRIYLADFGLARIAQAGESTISSDVMLGTPQYISPEQAMGQRELDGGTDIYSFGVVLYELIVGRVPFSADTPYSIIHDHIYAPLPLPHTIKEDTPEPIERLLLKALAKDRGDRFADVGSMVTAWQAATADMDLARATLPAEMGLTVAANELMDSSAASSTVATGERIGGESAAREEEGAPASNEDRSSVNAGEKRNPRRLWIGLIGFVALGCLCMAGAFVLSPRLRGQIKRTLATETDLALTQAVGVVGFTPGGETANPSNRKLPTLTPLSISDAQQRVTAAPDNPYAYLDLAMAYWEAGKASEAEQAFEAALERADNDAEFYVRAGDLTMQRQLWLEAAKLYLEAIHLGKNPASNDLLERTRQAVYLAASDPDATELMGELPGSRVSLDFVAIVQARHALYQGQLTRAKLAVRRLNDKKVELPELKLLEAEIVLHEGDKDQAIAQLEGLLADPTTPGWVRQAAEYNINENKSGE